VLDCLRIRPHQTHLWLKRALEYVEDLKPKQTYFTHITHDVKHARDSKLLPENVEWAYDGLIVSDEGSVMSDRRRTMTIAKKIEKSENFIQRQKERQLTRLIYKATNLSAFSRDYGLKEQIRQSAVSIMSKIAEGFERGRASEFHQFLSIAKRSCAELLAQIYVALDVAYITDNQFAQLMSAAREVGLVIGGLRGSLVKTKSL